MDPAPRATRAEVEAYLTANPGVSARSVASQLNVPLTTARSWIAAYRAKAGSGPRPTRPVGPKLAATCARDLSEDDRVAVLDTVRDIRAILRSMVARLRRAVEAAGPDELPQIHRDTAQAMLSLQKTGSGLLADNPGLLELARAAEPATADTEVDIEAALAALGVT